MGIMVLPTQAYSLRISKQPAAFSVLSLEGHEAISQTYQYVIEFTCARAALPIADVLGKRAKFLVEPVDSNAGLPAELAARVVKPPERLISGIVAEFDELSSSADETRYSVKLVPRLTNLDSEVGSRLFQNQTVPAVIESVLRHYGNTAVDFKFQLRAEYETHEYITQYAESALAFIQRIAAEEGIWFRFEQTPEHEVIVFGDDLDAYARDPKLSAPYREEGGFASRGADSVMTLIERRKRVAQSITVDDYNHRTAGIALLTQVNTARDDVTTVGNQYRWGEHYTTPDAGKRVATLRHQAELAQQVIFEGKGNVIGMTPGAVFRFTNRELDNAEHGLMITRVKHKASRKEAYTCEFTAIPSDRIYRSMVDPAAKRRITGILPARVMSPDNYKYAYMTPQSGYRIKSPFDLDEWSPGGTSRPVRLAKPYAGRDYGHHFPLIDGTEVAVIFTDGDPNRPIIIGAMHDSQHQDHVNNENNTRNILRTAGGNEMRMEDREGTEHVHLTTPFQASQLNLGHMVNDQREKRGLGGELRSDEHVVLRGGMGVLISAEAQPKANGQQLDMAEARTQLDAAAAQMKALADAAQIAQAHVAEVEKQRQFLEQRLDKLQQAVLLASAPAGVAITSGHHLQLAAQGNLMATATLVRKARLLVNGGDKDKDPSNATSEPEAPLASAFGPLLRVAGSDLATTGPAKAAAAQPANTSDISLPRYLERVTGVRLKLQQIMMSPDPDAMSRTAAQAILQGKTSDIGDSRDYASRVAASLGEQWSGFGNAVFQRPLDQTWDVVLQPATASLNETWRTAIVAAWNKSFGGRYPFADSDSDASLPEMARFLRADSGVISQFVSTQLGGIIERQGDQWVVMQATGRNTLRVDPEFVSALNRLTRVSNVLFPTGDASLRYELRAIPTPGITDVKIALSGRDLHYFNQREEWTPFVWPGDALENGTRIEWQTEQAGPRVAFDFAGRFGLIRLLERATVSQQDGARYLLRWPLGKEAEGVVPEAMVSPQAPVAKASSPEPSRRTMPRENDDWAARIRTSVTVPEAAWKPDESRVSRPSPQPLGPVKPRFLQVQLRSEVGAGPLDVLKLRHFVLPTRIFLRSDAGGRPIPIPTGPNPPPLPVTAIEAAKRASTPLPRGASPDIE